MNILVLLKKDGDDLKGEFLSAHNRMKYLKDMLPKVTFSPYLIKEYDDLLLRCIKRAQKREKYATFTHDGIEYKVVWVKSLFIDTILARFKHDKFFLYKKLKSIARSLPSSDLIISHSYYPGFIANYLYERCGTKYTVTWHGSDIHSNPKNSPAIRKKTAGIIESALVNYFVSKNLLDTSAYITVKGNKMVLYNGVNVEKFRVIKEDDKTKIRTEYSICKPLNVAFVGNLYPVKNVIVLPLVFRNLYSEFGNSIDFHIVGDGFLRRKLEKEFRNQSVKVRFWGNVMPDIIPGILNIMNLIVLPSKNEGLPLIATESLACGTPLLGSDVGGIKEVVGDDYVIPLDESFVTAFSNKAREILHNNPSVNLSELFLWENTSQKEMKSLETIIQN